MKKLLIVVSVLMLALVWWIYRQKNAPPEIPFAKVTRGTLVSALVTNGRVEPLRWEAVLAERSGVVEAFRAERGVRVKRGDPLAELGAQDARTDLSAAEAREAQARAELEVMDRGGRASDLAELDAEMARAKIELEVAGKERASLERLAEKQAATRQEASEAVRRAERAQLQLQQLARKRAALVDQADRTVAQAKLREAETATELARRRLEKAQIRAPMAGTVYETAGPARLVRESRRPGGQGRPDRQGPRARLRGRAGAGPRGHRHAGYDYLGRAGRAALARDGRAHALRDHGLGARGRWVKSCA